MTPIQTQAFPGIVGQASFGPQRGSSGGDRPVGNDG